MNPASRLLLAALLGAIAGGCSAPSDDNPASTWRGSVDTLPSGTIRVSNPVTGVWTHADAWRLVEDLRIGAMGGGGPDMFGEIVQVTFGPHGQILVLDHQAQEVRTFDVQGRYVRTLGGRGGGPGELSGAFGLAWNSDQQLWIADIGNDRYSVFDSSGTYLASHRRGLPGVVYPWQGGFGPDGRLYDVIGRGSPDGRSEFIYFALDSAAAVVDTLPPLTYRPSGAGAIPGSASLLAPRLTFRFDPEGRIWFGATDQYRLYQRDFLGDTLRIVTRPFEPRSVTEAEKDSMLAEAARYVPDEFDRSQLPQVKPVFQRLLVDDIGNLWVQRGEQTADEGTVFDVLAPDGRFLGEVHAPIPLEWMAPAEIRGDHLLGATTDALGVSYVVRLRIDRPASSGSNGVG